LERTTLAVVVQVQKQTLARAGWAVLAAADGVDTGLTFLHQLLVLLILVAGVVVGLLIQQHSMLVPLVALESQLFAINQPLKGGLAELLHLVAGITTIPLQLQGHTQHESLR
jgi:hypothetical protein